MQKKLLCLMALMMAAKPYEVREILIPTRAPEIIQHFHPSSVSILKGDAALIQVPEDQIDLLSSVVHERLGGCGGFFDITADVQDGTPTAVIMNKYALATRFLPFSAPQAVLREESIAQLINQVDPNFIQNFLLQLSSFDDRSATTSNGTRAADFIAQKAEELGKGLVGFQVRKIQTRTYPMQPSIVATYLGRNAGLPHVVIGGHMDTLSNNKPGADDDGSGSAVVMEALRAIATNNTKAERTIDFIWYAAEERGLVGSANVAKDFQRNQIAVSAAIQFDMTGWVNPAGVHDIYLTDDYIDAGLNQTLESIINVYLPTLSVGHATCGYACSDHATWTANNVPAVYPFESHHDDYNRRIHTSSDKIDYLSIEHMTKFAKIAVAFLGQMANFR